MKNNFIPIIVVAVGWIILPTLANSQGTAQCDSYLEKLPYDLKPDDKTPQQYVMITDYMDYDLYGNFLQKKRVTGECTLLKDGYVQWNNVMTYYSGKLNEPYQEGEKQSYMENFTYHPSSDILSDSFFKDLPESTVYTKNLIWDLTMFEAFAWYKWDSLKLNNSFRAKDINSAFEMPGVGNFENKDIRITWSGITKTNEKMCAIIKYSALNNPLDMHFQNLTIKGRSNYWGDIQVSLTDKQIEYADLYEDVLMDVTTEGQVSGNKINTSRYITLRKAGK